MGSTLLVLRTLLADQLDAETPTSGSDPSLELLNTYINNSIRKITRRDEPRELMLAVPIAADIVAAANTVTIPATVFVPQIVYYKDSGSNWRQLQQLEHKDLIQSVGANAFFDTSDTGDLRAYSIQGTVLSFDKHFYRTTTGAINILGIKPPTTLSNNIDTTELPSDYDLLITYESALLFAQRDDDEENIARWKALADFERSELKANLQTNNNKQFVMSPENFHRNRTSFANSSVLFGTR
jgi:hypothetical protein